MEKKSEGISCKNRNKTKMCSHVTFMQHSTESPSYNNQTRKINFKKPKQKGRGKTDTVYRWHDTTYQFSQFRCSLISDSLPPPWTAARQASLSITNSRSSLTLTSIESVMPMQPSHPLSSPSPPAPNPSQHQSLFQWVNSSHEVAKVLEFQL